MRAPKAILPKQGRRLRTNLKRGVTLTIYLAQNIGQLTPAVHTSELTYRAANHEPRATVCATLGSIRDGRPIIIAATVASPALNAVDTNP